MSQQDPVNPYIPPVSPINGPPPGMPQFSACPACGASNARKVSFTWWGGMIGPKVLNHVQCEHCRTKFNGKTGKSNKNAIVIYVIVMLALSMFLLFAFTALLLTLLFDV